MEIMSKWDDDRLVARVVTRGTKSEISGLDEVGFVVQVLDTGPLGERLAKPVALFDSEGVHGTAGRFPDHETAQTYADRRLAGMMRLAREIEAERHRRKEQLSERQRDLWAEEKRQKEIAKAANKAAKEADEQARKLADEAEDPVISLSCNPSEDGWSLWVAPCWTDGTQDGDPRQLVIEGSGMLGPRKLVDSEGRSDAPRPGRDPAQDAQTYERTPGGNRKPPKRKAAQAPTKAPQHVQDAAGLPLRVGSKVLVLLKDGERLQEHEASVEEILRQDPSGSWWITVADEAGIPADVLSGECRKVEGREPTDDEPEAA